MSSQSTKDTYDAIVIGGGPSGAVCALGLAKAGRSVLLMEKSEFPRFHIGESMIPYVTKLLEKLGLLEEARNGPFVHKLAVEVAFETGAFQRIEFRHMAPGQIPLAFNLERAKFDELLLSGARRAGADIQTRTEVKRLLFEGDRLIGVEAERDGERRAVHARFVVDASGRAGLVAKHFKLRKMNPRLENVAIFQHYEALVKANNPSDPSDFVLSCHDNGWVWAIPLGPDKLSVGAVVSAAQLKGKPPGDVFGAHLARAPRIHGRVAGAKPCFDEFRIESDYCYHSERLAGPGYFITGDAGCFVDPLFSGGLYLASMTGLRAGELIDEILAGRDEADARSHFESFAKTGYDTYFRIIYAFYYGAGGNVARMFESFPGGFPYFLQTVCGDFWGRPDQPVLRHLRAESSWQTFEQPFEILHGCPTYPDAHYSADNPPVPAGE